MIRRLSRKLKSFGALPLFTKLWLLPVWVMLAIARAAVLLLPFRRIAPLLGADRGTAAHVPLLPPVGQDRALVIGRTVRLAAAYAPWQANCFAQAIVAAILLRLYGLPYTIFFGLRRASPPETGMQAHAWTSAGRVAVTGGEGFGGYTVVGAFTR